MKTKKLSDKRAREMLQKWPERPPWLWCAQSGSNGWFRARPKAKNSTAKAPSISFPRAAKFHTWPDGLWLNLGIRGVVDVFSIEVCGTIQNLHDKRSRYSVIGGSLTVSCSREWLLEEFRTQDGKPLARYEDLELTRKVSSDWHLPIRYLRVLYALPDDRIQDWQDNIVAASHEYYCGHSFLRDRVDGRLRSFIEGMDPGQHFAVR
jgi:hypothetical protein